MNLRETYRLIQEDRKRLGRFPFFNHSFKLTFYYRIGRYLYLKGNPLWKFFYLIHRHHEVKYGVQFFFDQDIDGGLLFGHFSCIVIGCEHIGKRLTMYQGCTIGAVHGKGAPNIGDDVVMYAGSKIVGKVKVGNNVVIGANAVVVTDIPDNAVVVGAPGRVVSLNASKITQYFK